MSMTRRAKPTLTLNPSPMIKYRFYATLLDGFQNYLNSDIIYSRYWGFSENPPMTVDEFRQKQFQGLIDRINRVPFESEMADRGTAFNEVVDCLIENRTSDKVQVEKVYNAEPVKDVNENLPAERKVTALKVGYNNRVFVFDINLCREFAQYYQGALTQQFVSAPLDTKYGEVEIYGYVDELMPQSVHDIKTTGKYFVGKFRDHWQHICYPYCYMQNGMDVKVFEYNVAELNKYGGYNTYTETYVFDPQRDTEKLRAHCEMFIDFLNDNRDLITDKKIFNLQ